MTRARVPNRQYIRRQRLSRLRKAHNIFVGWLEEQADRLSVPARALRDSLRKLGSLAPIEVTAAANAGDAEVALSSAATTDFSTPSTITRVGGDFVADGFAAGDTIQVESGPNAGRYTLASAVALTLVVDETFAQSDAASTDLIFRISPGSRD